VVTLLGATEIRALAERLDVSPTKKWGQNFVHDANTVRKIVTAAKLQAGESVVEIGPGLGSLTLGLLEQGHPVTAIEIDPRLAAELPATAATHGVTADMLTVIQADALAVTELPAAPTAIVANLPYNVSVPVLIHLLETFPTIRRVLVMVQAEVGHRIAADPGSKVYGVPSVKAAWWGDWNVEGTVSRRVFWPEPNVDSVLVGMTAHATPGDEPLRRRTFAIADAAFGQRRKTLRQALSALAGSTTAAADLCEAAGIDSGARGEQLTLDQFVALASVPS
jgi:16S rRNA (adenine1518-N6/adenine1519-N6)-dimethyltransferase